MDLYTPEFQLSMVGLTPSDAFVFNEIYGKEDAYQRSRLLPLIRQKDVIEVGGHKGYFSILAGSVASRVIVFEPSNTNFQFLRKNIELNRFHHIPPRKQGCGSHRRKKVSQRKSEDRRSPLAI